MSLSMTLVAIAVGLFMIAQVIIAMKAKKISEYQGIPWLIAALCLIILALCPWLIHLAADFFSITWAPAVLIFAFIAIIGYILFNHSKEISILKSQVTELTMQIGILKEQLREEKNNGEYKEEV